MLDHILFMILNHASLPATKVTYTHTFPLYETRIGRLLLCPLLDADHLRLIQ
ncbi:hypothetical protein I309_01099 [Cryptococcus deuterogattii LA55]|nr:hypothetical protein I309_01099 [Cryptococcus deuterogattii LA55]KIR92655.1 hypothetical protein I304_03232 [Cryptococcus deuterogattii CBS 10090]